MIIINLKIIGGRLNFKRLVAIFLIIKLIKLIKLFLLQEKEFIYQVFPFLYKYYQPIFLLYSCLLYLSVFLYYIKQKLKNKKNNDYLYFLSSLIFYFYLIPFVLVLNKNLFLLLSFLFLN